MSETVIEFLSQFGISPELTVFILSMLPLVELRGGIIASAFFDISLIKGFIICFVGNILPIPFILLFIKQIFVFLKKFNWSAKIVKKLEEKAMAKSESVQKKQLLGLFFFVAVPLPGTGGWTGALIAALMEIPIKKSFPTIALGVFCAGIIMVIISYFVPGLFGISA